MNCFQNAKRFNFNSSDIFTHRILSHNFQMTLTFINVSNEQSFALHNRNGNVFPFIHKIHQHFEIFAIKLAIQRAFCIEFQATMFLLDPNDKIIIYDEQMLCAWHVLKFSVAVTKRCNRSDARVQVSTIDRFTNKLSNVSVASATFKQFVFADLAVNAIRLREFTKLFGVCSEQA